MGEAGDGAPTQPPHNDGFGAEVIHAVAAVLQRGIRDVLDQPKGLQVFECNLLAKAALAAAASALADKALDEIADWEWAAPIPDTYTIRSPRESGGCFLHCTEHGDLFSVGEMELWEFALDARKHHQEHHAKGDHDHG